MGEAIWDNIRAIDLLQAMRQVSTERIGCLGHGQGGTLALLTAAVDQRVVATVTSAGFASFARPQQQTGEVPAFDFHEVLAAVAPRALYVRAPLKDERFDVAGVKEAVASASAVFELRGAASVFEVAHPDLDQGFPDQARADASQWLAQRLQGGGPGRFGAGRGGRGGRGQ
jgi:dienelactone hydrolase